MTDLLESALAAQLGRPLYDAINKHLADGQQAEDRLHVAEATARHWHQAALDRGDIPAAHAIACIRAALGGETDPGQLGWPEPAPATAATQATEADGLEPVDAYRDAIQRVQSSGPRAAAATEPNVCPHGANTSRCPCLACEAEQFDADALAAFGADLASQTRPKDASKAEFAATKPPDTITDPAYLQAQYAAVIRRWWDDDDDGANEIAAAVLRVRDRHLQQLRQRLTLADAELQQWAAAESADAAAGSYAGRAEEAEQQRDQLAGVLREALAQFVHETHPGRRCLQTGHVPIGTVERWHAALNPPKEPTP